MSDLHLDPDLAARAREGYFVDAVERALAPCFGTSIRGQHVHCARRWTKADPRAHDVCSACYARMAVLNDTAWRGFVRSSNSRLAINRRP